jgi:hypothetical protein
MICYIPHYICLLNISIKIKRKLKQAWQWEKTIDNANWRLIVQAMLDDAEQNSTMRNKTQEIKSTFL